MPGSSAKYGATPPIVANGLNSCYLTAGIIIADVVGAGILSMPIVMKNFGWAVGIAMTLVSIAFNNHVGLLQHRVYMEHRESHTMSQLSYDVYRHSDEATADSMRIKTATLQGAFLFSMLGLYVLTLGKSLGMLFYDVHACLPGWCALGCCIVFVFLATTQTMGGWSSLVGLNIITILGSIVIPLAGMYSLGVEETRPSGAQVLAVAPFDLGASFSATATLMFALCGQVLYVEIMSEMKDAEQFPTAFTWMAAPFMAVSFALVGTGGYYFRGDAYEGMVGDNIEFGPVFRIAAACLMIHMVVTFLIKGVVLCNAIIKRVFPGSHCDSANEQFVWSMTVLGLLGATWTMAQVVPFFTDLVELLGASLVPLTCYVIPILTFLQFSRNSEGSGGCRVGPIEKAIIHFELLVSVVLIIGGTYSSMLTIIDKWETYGYPFECHCEDLWNTCDCSLEHAGMEGKCPAL